ncbi:MAG: alginate lyase family protein [Candidatus Krumholzibacteriota bacterium]|nr:alginate lyase family protein [Candidatus Krumholzibacteriota bacterium]
MRGIYWILLVMLVLLPACSRRSPFEPEEEIPDPALPGQTDLFLYLDLHHEGLEEVLAAYARGDSAVAVNLLLSYFLATDPPTAAHISYDEPALLAAEIMNGRITLEPHPPAELPSDPDWKENPFDDINWRFQYHAFRWPMALLYSWEQDKNQDYLDRFIFLLEDYAHDNFYGQPASDMTWNDMGTSLRTEHWLYCWRLFAREGLLDEQRIIDYLIWIRTQGYMLASKIRYREISNHGMFQNRALMTIALVLPELRESDSWFTTGFERLDAQILNLVSSEGVYLEPSPFYHLYVYNVLRETRALLISAGRDLRPEAFRRMEGMSKFAALILQPNGKLPMFGDCPESVILDPYRGGHPWLDYSISGGEAGERPGIRCYSYPQSGYVIFRSGWGETRPFREETHAVFDVGFKDGTHGHYDGMSFTLCSQGENLIVDSGYYAFEGSWREFFESPEAHNVLVPAGGASSRRPDPTSLVWSEGEGSFFRSAKLQFENKREWTRCFIYLEPDDILILDQVSGVFEGEVDQLFHLPPGTQVDTTGGNLLAETGVAKLEISQAQPCELLVLEGASDPLQGWYSPVYGSKTSNPVARYRRTGPVPCFYTLLHTHQGENSLLSFRFEEKRADGSLVFRIERESGYEEVSVQPGTGRVERGPVHWFKAAAR